MKTDLYQLCGHCWIFPICWHIECSILTASSFRIWKSSAGIPLPPLSLFIVRLLGPSWLHTPGSLALGLSVSWRSFLYSSSVYSCHLFLISSACVMSLPSLFFIVPTFAWNVPLASPIFLKRSIIFLLWFSSISLHWSLKNAFLSLLAILWNSASSYVYLPFSSLPFLSLLFSAICKTSSNYHFAYLHFFFFDIVLVTTSCKM